MTNIQIQLKTTNKNILFLYYNLIIKIFTKLEIKYKTIIIKKKIKYTLLKSPHVFKKAREQFEIKKYKMIIYSEQKNKFIYLKYFLLNKPKIIKLTIKQKRK